ncbi:hypothetical protein D5125_02545 [Magnetovirga frankeli]|uniref:hypothetical protein n=1 Tax=Magnetovirga frankeli TaxID=947516 RepID=UPI001293CDEA|nr:hypothetical protein D5125_02545 [gamma proteobacterium SS-5]
MTLSRITVLIKQVPEWARGHILPADIKFVIKSDMDDGQVIDYLNQKAEQRCPLQRPRIQVEGFYAG